MHLLITALVFALLISFLEIYVAYKFRPLRNFLRRRPVVSVVFSLFTSFMLSALFAVSGLIVAMAAVMAIVFTMIFHIGSSKVEEASTSSPETKTAVQKRVTEVKTDASEANSGLKVLAKIIVFPLWIAWKILVFILKTIGRLNRTGNGTVRTPVNA